MFDNVEALSPVKHRDLRFKTVQDYAFARGLRYAPITHSEMFEAAKHFPIVFPKSGTPVVLLGADGRNHFVDDDGRWTAGYRPAHVVRYPFILGKTENANEMVDQAKWKALPDETVPAWHEQGTLALVHAHLISLTNLSRLTA
jgi:hypothetical protein